MAGRPADPTRARRQTGNRPKPGEAKPKAEVVVAQVVPGLPAAPAGLPTAAVPLWETMVGELWARGVKDADLEGVRMMVMAGFRNRQAAAAVDEYGLIVEGPKGPMVNPAVKVEKETAATFIRFAEAFGLTLAARLRLGLMQLAGESLLQGLMKDLDS